MEEFRDPTQLADAVRSRVLGRTSPLIGVDGSSGIGKGTLSRDLEKQLGGMAVEIDCYSQKNGQPYRQQLKYNDIARDLTKLRQQGKPVIVDGICLLDVMDTLGEKLDAHVYMKTVNEIRWPDEDICDPKQINSRRLKHPVRLEVASYHRDRDPLNNPDFLFVRVIHS